MRDREAESPVVVPVHQSSPPPSPVLVTLGIAASRVVVGEGGLAGSGKLTADTYGAPREVTIGGARCTWIAAGHPVATAVSQARHPAWLSDGGFSGIFRSRGAEAREVLVVSRPQ